MMNDEWWCYEYQTWMSTSRHVRGTLSRGTVLRWRWRRQSGRRLYFKRRSTDAGEGAVLCVQQIGEVLATTGDVQLTSRPVSHHQSVDVVQSDVAAELYETPEKTNGAAVAGCVDRRTALRYTTEVHTQIHTFTNSGRHGHNYHQSPPVTNTWICIVSFDFDWF